MNIVFSEKPDLVQFNIVPDQADVDREVSILKAKCGIVEDNYDRAIWREFSAVESDFEFKTKVNEEAAKLREKHNVGITADTDFWLKFHRDGTEESVRSWVLDELIYNCETAMRSNKRASFRAMLEAAPIDFDHGEFVKRVHQYTAQNKVLPEDHQDKLTADEIIKTAKYQIRYEIVDQYFKENGELFVSDAIVDNEVKRRAGNFIRSDLAYTEFYKWPKLIEDIREECRTLQLYNQSIRGADLQTIDISAYEYMSAPAPLLWLRDDLIKIIDSGLWGGLKNISLSKRSKCDEVNYVH